MAGGVRGFYREFTAGVTRGELRRLFQRDAAQAYRVPTREQDLSREPRGRHSRKRESPRHAAMGPQDPHGVGRHGGAKPRT